MFVYMHKEEEKWDRMEGAVMEIQPYTHIIR